MLELVYANAFLAVGFCFCGAVGIYAAFGEEVGAAACDYERPPTIAVFFSFIRTCGIGAGLRSGGFGRLGGRWRTILILPAECQLDG